MYHSFFQSGSVLNLAMLILPGEKNVNTLPRVGMIWKIHLSDLEICFIRDLHLSALRPLGAKSLLQQISQGRIFQYIPPLGSVLLQSLSNENLSAKIFFKIPLWIMSNSKY